MTPFPGPRVIRLLPLVLVAGTTVWADVIIKMKVEADVIADPERGPQSEPCRVSIPSARTGDILILTLGADRVRLDRPAMSIILRLDQQRLSFVFPGEKKYASLKYPIAYQKYQSAMWLGLDPGLVEFRLETLTGPEKTSALGRAAVKYSATMANDLRTRWRATFVLTTDFPGDPGPVLALRNAIHNLQFGGSGWRGLLPLAGGLPLIWEEALRQPETEFKYREETVEIEQREVSSGTYDVPEGFVKIEYDPACIQAR